MDRPTHSRARSKSTWSFKSDKSSSSAGKKEKLEETSAEKANRHFGKESKADPNAAMNEVQPIAAALSASTIGSLRDVQHVDAQGNPITDPDLSNPTRHRFERPLDTIRSFEAAIDGEYKRRSVLNRADTAPSEIGMGYGGASRRSSYFGGYNDNRRQSQYSSFGGYYGDRQSIVSDNHGPPMAGPSRNRYSQRMRSEPFVPRYPNGANGAPVYPNHGPQLSRDTVGTNISNGTASGSEAFGNSTDPSSENSSIDRYMAGGDQYGYSGVGGAPPVQPIMEEHGDYSSQMYPRPMNGGPPQAAYGRPQGDSWGPPPPNKAPIKLTGDGSAPSTQPQIQRQESKRKSWFKRRFSKD